jgi:hypothetical protein
MPGHFRLALFCLCLMAATLVACGNQPPVIPTQIPVAALPTASPTVLPPTRDLNQPANSVATMTPAPSPTPRPPTATPTPADVWVRIAVPEEGATMLMGSDVIVRGLMQRNPAETVWVSLFSATGRLLVEAQARLGENSWEAGFAVPETVSGTAFLAATVRDAAGEPLATDRLRVELALDAATSERFLVLMQPLVEETAVVGFNLLFAGQTLLPAGNVITVEVWANCEERVAQQSFVMGRSSRSFPWQGFLVVPKDMAPGVACAIARAGEPGTENWREAGRLITVLAQDDPQAQGIRLGYPPANAAVTAGEALLLYGTALNVSEGPVTVSMSLANGRAIGQVSTVSDFWGYWETTITIPIDVEGEAQITITAGEPDDDTYSEMTTLVTVNPAPTPTAVPPLPTSTPER